MRNDGQIGFSFEARGRPGPPAGRRYRGGTRLPVCAWPSCGRGTRASEPASDGKLYCSRHAPPCADCAAMGEPKPSCREDDRIGRPLCDAHWKEALTRWRKAARAAGRCVWCGASREGSLSVRFCVSCAARDREKKARYYREVWKPRVEQDREIGREAAAYILSLPRPAYADVGPAIRMFVVRVRGQNDLEWIYGPVTPPAEALAACRRVLREASPDDRARMAPKLVRWITPGRRRRGRVAKKG